MFQLVARRQLPPQRPEDFNNAEPVNGHYQASAREDFHQGDISEMLRMKTPTLGAASGLQLIISRSPAGCNAAPLRVDLQESRSRTLVGRPHPGLWAETPQET